MADDNEVPRSCDGERCTDATDDIAAESTSVPLVPTPCSRAISTEQSHTDAASPDAAAVGGGTQPAVHENVSADERNHEVLIQVESFGSGAILHSGLKIPFDKTVGDLRKLVLSNVSLPPRTRAVRLFVGHGGAELDNDASLISDTRIAVDFDNKPLVPFAELCTSRPYHPCRRQHVRMRVLWHQSICFRYRARPRCASCVWVVQPGESSQTRGLWRPHKRCELASSRNHWFVVPPCSSWSTDYLRSQRRPRHSQYDIARHVVRCMPVHMTRIPL